MHSLHCIDVARTLRQVSVSEVPHAQKSWAPDTYAAAVSKLKSLNEYGLRLADSIDTYADAWNSFIQHGDEHRLRKPSFSQKVNDIACANEKIITDIRKDLKSSVKENGMIITRHSGDPGQECKLRCAQVVPESRETRQIREQILGWSMKDYCYHHPLRTLLSKRSLRWRQLEYATSLLKLLLLAQIHAEHVHAGQPFDAKAERHKQLEAMQDLGAKRQQLCSKEETDSNTSLHYGNPIGTLTVNNLHPLPLSIMVSRWFQPQQDVTSIADPQNESLNNVLQSKLQSAIQSFTDLSTEETELIVEELHVLKIQYADIMRKTNNIIARLSDVRLEPTTQGNTSDRTSLADTIHNYVSSKGSSLRQEEATNSDASATCPTSQQADFAELDGAGRQEISGSCNHHPVEKPSSTPSHSRRSSVWGLEDACDSQNTFDLAEL